MNHLVFLLYRLSISSIFLVPISYLVVLVKRKRKKIMWSTVLMIRDMGVEGKGVDRDGVEVRVKRKHGDSEEEIVNGWTKEQEMALQRAYFASKPSPHFWKNVSKLVKQKTLIIWGENDRIIINNLAVVS